MTYSWTKHRLHFLRPGGTSRGVLDHKDSWMIIANDDAFQYPGIGECSTIQGLSPDPFEEIEPMLDQICTALSNGKSIPDLSRFPALKFAVETLNLDVEAKGSKIFQDDSFISGQEGILINGLIWMGDVSFMHEQLASKIEAGFNCIKIKIGSLDFEVEKRFLRELRERYGQNIQLRLDANGAFTQENALEKLNQLSAFEIHSIEQPIMSNQWEEMAALCQSSPIPIALDEELIGVKSRAEKQELLDSINPQFVILKPSLIGGLAESAQWIELAESKNIGWWITSALESNIGLNAIAQFAYNQGVTTPQGLGTGGLFSNNLDSPLSIRGEMLRFNPDSGWNLEVLSND